MFLPLWNRRFTVAEANAIDAHRPLGPGHELAAILSRVENRIVSNDYTVRWQGRRYQNRNQPLWAVLRDEQARRPEREP